MLYNHLSHSSLYNYSVVSSVHVLSRFGRDSDQKGMAALKTLTKRLHGLGTRPPRLSDLHYVLLFSFLSYQEFEMLKGCYGY
ncbi:hypothetical protein VN97_g4613 [Penicillium thymicola]|uniref:Uncharacterized protein n=1 Tax=Penicillium thymicola TaxID=293382 RepID=A0AAI9TKA6_PENTH|nr:hypothetical protein VN97_g4613 [Penicillium thymicola]